jgi:hypothetical protein
MRPITHELYNYQYKKSIYEISPVDRNPDSICFRIFLHGIIDFLLVLQTKQKEET